MSTKTHKPKRNSTRNRIPFSTNRRSLSSSSKNVSSSPKSPRQFNLVNETSFRNFDSFYEENKHNLFIPEDQIGTRGLNHVNIERWYSSIRTYSPTEIIKSNYLFFAKTLIEFFKYIDFHTFMEKLTIITNELIGEIMKDKYVFIYFYIPEQLNKSNMWVTLLVFHILKTRGIFATQNIRNKIRFSSKIIDFYKVCAKNEANHTLCIYCDDMSYTGSQVNENIIKIRYMKLLERLKIFIAVPYLTFLAKTRITKDSNMTKYLIIPKNSVILYSYFEELNAKYNNSGSSKQHKDKVDYIKNMFMNSDNEYDIDNQACNGDFNKIAIYFDHKVADELSTFKKILFTGSYPVNNEDECILNPLILGCLNEDIKEFKTNNCITSDGFKNEISCFPAYYKTIQYTINHKKIKTTRSVLVLKSLY